MSVLDLEHDIYRGEPPSQPQSLYTAPSIITTSSSSSLLSIGRLGAIAENLEFAISRWARNARRNYFSASDSSLSYSSSSSSLPHSTLTKSRQIRRHTRLRSGSSLSSLRTLLSERAIATRISRMKALEASRRIPQQFSLYLPPSITHKSAQNKSGVAALENDRLHPPTISTALPLVLNQLDLAIKQATKNSRLCQRHRGPPCTSHALDDNYPGIKYLRARRGRKGKRPESPPRPKLLPIIEKPMAKPQAWFLDVASPTWADLRAIGKVQSAVADL